MRRLLQLFLKDEGGLVVSAEIVLVTTVLVIGAMTGLSAVSNAVNSELNSVAAACYNSYQDGYSNGGYNQGYSSPAYNGDELAGYGPVGPDEMP
ncbi:MAG: branched-chain amino acid aminotransferase [Planctomycetaceae bacterium]|jgi:Flp pilus assembly pilin Flp